MTATPGNLGEKSQKVPLQRNVMGQRVTMAFVSLLLVLFQHLAACLGYTADPLI
jgi:hypothetical protein